MKIHTCVKEVVEQMVPSKGTLRVGLYTLMSHRHEFDTCVSLIGLGEPTKNEKSDQFTYPRAITNINPKEKRF